MIVSLMRLSNIYVDRGEVDECLKVTAEGIILAKELKNHTSHAAFLRNKGSALVEAGNYADSRTSFSKALKITEEIEDQDFKYLIKSEIYASLVRYVQAQYEKAHKTEYKDSILYFGRKYYQESLKLSAVKFPRKKYGVAQAARILGEAYVDCSEYKEAEKYFDISEKLMANGNDNRVLAALYNAKGKLEFQEGNNEKALEYYEKALKLSTHFHYSDLTVCIYENFINFIKK
ncbi:tetratricopeptide repeat protein [Chryseobacterium arthrosphaerae]|uniref:Tetratricopeptide repeat protein n=1 Tax=Chryseobacterium arthrosphaerae TaxID=651561 RepID=A0A432DYH7_9FLAO|nr:tetratricopeptide repeat protein [Chryseobacterium arthrosphaerae]